ncbi:MAG: DUF3299 domain-containing protein [Candidatus Hydrogenedentes bacterium]|nr:DUF3299 domain-containing protein [Candidatus Hydrogenedentota bacterium]
MRRRAKRDLFVIFGVVVVLALVAFANYNFQRNDLARRMDALRRQAEKEQINKGFELLDWKLLTDTKGSARKGPSFLDQLRSHNGEHVNLVGFMQPLDQFRGMTEFILLPLPIECYFCQIPPISHVVLVHMAESEGVDLVEEPVIINGTLTLNEGPTKFFYTIENARRGAAIGDKLTPRRLKEEHMVPRHTQTEVLQPGFEPPKTPDLN